MKPFIITFLLWIVSYCLWAQKEFKWGEAPETDRQMTVYTPDSSAEAVVLFVRYRISFVPDDKGLRPHYEMYRRVKLLKETALDKYGSFEILYRSNAPADEFNWLKAQVIQPDGSITELSKKDFVTERINEDYSKRKAAFPNLKVGSIIEYRYELTLNNSLQLEPCVFQESIPVRYGELKFSMPDLYDYVYLIIGEQPFQKEDLPLTYDNVYGRNCAFYHTLFTANDIPAIVEEPYITTLNDYLLKVRFQLRSYTSLDDFKPTKILGNWDEAAKKMQDEIDKQYLKKSNYYKLWQAVSPLLQTAQTQTEKANIIYNFLNQNIQAEGYGMWEFNNLNDNFVKKKATPSALNMMMIACLNEAGIPAYPMLISTRSHGAPILQYPIISQFNHLLCYTVLDNIPTLIEAGNPLRPLGMLQKASLNKKGWILESQNPRWEDITPATSTTAAIADFSLDTEGNLKGYIQNMYKGYSAVAQRELTKGKGNYDQMRKILSTQQPNMVIDSLTTTNWEKLNEPFKVNIYSTISQAATINDNLIYLKPTLQADFEENPFKHSERYYPVDIPHPIKNNYALNITLPKGYTIDEIPQPLTLALPNNDAKYSYLIANNGDKIQLSIKLEINRLLYSAHEYQTIRDFFNRVADKQAEFIVLKKQ